MDEASYEEFRRKAQLYVAQKLASLEELYHLDRATGWALDPKPDAGLFVIQDSKGTPLLRTEALEIGTYHAEESTWRWGWSNISFSGGQRQRLRSLVDLASLTGKAIFRSDQAVQIEAKPRIGTMLGIVIVQRAIRKLDLGAKQPWADLMRENSPSPAAIPVPAFIATGSADTIVSPAVVEDFARLACRLGKAVNFISITGGQHATVARTDSQTTLAWIDARFSGEPQSGTCAFRGPAARDPDF